MTKLLLIEDDPTLSDLLCEYLTSQHCLVEQAFDGMSGLQKAQNNDYDVILLDVMLPKLDGFDVLKKLRSTHLTPVIMLSAKSDDFDRIFGLELGADDYLPKPFNHRELLARIHAISRRIDFEQQSKHIQCLTHQHIAMNIKARKVTVNEQPITLTGTEFSILKMLLSDVGHVISKHDISQQVLGRRLAPFDRSIDMHVSNLRKKIARHSEQICIQTIRGTGYVLLAE